MLLNDVVSLVSLNDVVSLVSHKGTDARAVFVLVNNDIVPFCLMKLLMLILFLPVVVNVVPFVSDNITDTNAVSVVVTCWWR